MSYRASEDLGVVAVMVSLMLAAVFCTAAYFAAGKAGQRAAIKEYTPIPFIVEERTKSNAPVAMEEGELCYTRSKDAYLRSICKDLNEAYAAKKAQQK